MRDIIEKIAIGTVQFGLKYGISNGSGQTSLEEACNILTFARENNIDTLDTAFAYGNSEETIGSIGCAGWNIVTKLPTEIADSAEMHLDKSLSRMKVESVYGYLTHNADTLLENPDLWLELQGLKEKNKVKKIGYSLYTPAQLESLLSLGMIPDIVQLPFSFVDRRFLPYLPDLKQRGVEVHTRSAFLQGLFFVKADKLNSFFDPLRPIIERLQKQSGSDSKLAAALVKYCLEINEIDRVVIGINSCEQLRDNISSLRTDDMRLDDNIYSSCEIPEDVLLPYKWPAISN